MANFVFINQYLASFNKQTNQKNVSDRSRQIHSEKDDTLSADTSSPLQRLISISSFAT